MKYIKEIAEILEILDTTSINESDKLNEVGFDSLATINLISFITDKTDEDIQVEDLLNLETVKDLNDYINKKINN
jgi:acyl carrier protein